MASSIKEDNFESVIKDAQEALAVVEEMHALATDLVAETNGDFNRAKQKMHVYMTAFAVARVLSSGIRTGDIDAEDIPQVLKLAAEGVGPAGLSYGSHLWPLERYTHDLLQYCTNRHEMTPAEALSIFRESLDTVQQKAEKGEVYIWRTYTPDVDCGEGITRGGYEHEFSKKRTRKNEDTPNKSIVFAIACERCDSVKYRRQKQLADKIKAQNG